MLDPVTVSTFGSMVASALASGAVVMANGALTAAGEDAYNKLKLLVERIVGKDIPRMLETDPKSKPCTALIAQQIDSQQEKLEGAERQELLQAFETLQSQLALDGHDVSCEVNINNVVATHGSIAVGGNMINYASSMQMPKKK